MLTLVSPDGMGVLTAPPVEYCDAEVMRRIRRRSLARLRSEVEPVLPQTLGVFTPRWQHVAPVGARPDLRGADGVLTVVDQLAGALVPASALESLVLPARVRDYSPTLLDELTSSGEVVWVGGGALPGVDGLLTLLPADAVAELAPVPPATTLTELHHHLLDALAGGGGRFFRDLLPPDELGPDGHAASARPAEVLEALWDLVWAGRVTNDTLAPVRARLGGGRPTHAAPRTPARARSLRPGAGLRRAALSRAALAGARPATAVNLPAAAGRWSLVRAEPRAGRAEDVEARTARVTALTVALLERHGVLVRGAAGLEDLPGGFGAAYQVLRRLEEAGQVRRGYLVEGLGAAQFALPEVVDRLRGDAAELTARRERAAAGDAAPRVALLAATDPANPYGAALGWPPTTAGEGHRPGRKAGAAVVLVDGALVLYVEKGGRTLLSFTGDPVALDAAAAALGPGGRHGRARRAHAATRRRRRRPRRRPARCARRWTSPGSAPPRAACGCAPAPDTAERGRPPALTSRLGRRGPAASRRPDAVGDDDRHAGVEVEQPRVEDHVVLVDLARVPAVEVDGHVGADLVLALLPLARPLDVDAGVAGRRAPPAARAARRAARAGRRGGRGG